MPELAFVAPSGDADPTAGLFAALCEEVGHQDAAARLCAIAPELRADRAYIVASEAGAAALSEPQLVRTIAVLSAAPGGNGFERELEWGRPAGAVFHVNAAATERLLELGVPARHLQLGHPNGLAALDAAAEPGLVVFHDRGGYFDWLGALAAIRTGAVVLHERSLGLAPLVAGRHLFVAASPALDEMAVALRRNPERLRGVRVEADRFLRTALPLALAAAALIGAARALVAQPLPAAYSTPGQPAPSSK